MANAKLIDTPRLCVPTPDFEPPPLPPGLFSLADLPPLEPFPGLCLRIEFAQPPEPLALQLSLREGLMRGIARGLAVRAIAEKRRR